MTTNQTPSRVTPPAPLVVNVRQAAALLGVSERMLWSLTAPRGDLPAVRLGSRVLYRMCDLEAYLAKRAQAQQTQAQQGGGGHGATI
jgi:excisionase family DNA binding protein